MKRGRRELDVALLVVERDREIAGLFRDAVELVDEVHVPRRAPELAVGDRLETDLLLPAHGLADRVVLEAPQRVPVDAAGGEVLTGSQHLWRAQQAADVVGAEGWARARGHRDSPSISIIARIHGIRLLLQARRPVEDLRHDPEILVRRQVAEGDAVVDAALEHPPPLALERVERLAVARHPTAT